ncbi:GGDEF domain-containing protein [Paenibacillus polymyxa]|uniref:GGDEF domain-containing protein n=1 Tax=Paenibacillus polymyxa TaxID=1406 RepID=UPI0025B6B3F2|nr:GGDEF domain-containing protein [Paenibacillus polymyxa]MDN4106640.1 GGDEF domain-containing protein [Paenibacillus polymyxa]
MFRDLLGANFSAGTVFIALPLTLILLYVTHHLYLARRSRYLPITVCALVMTVSQFISLMSYVLGSTLVGEIFEKISFTSIVALIVFLTQVQWVQKRSEKITLYSLVMIHLIFILLGSLILSNVVTILISLLLLNQLKENVKAAIKTTIILLVLPLQAILNFAAILTKFPELWTLSNLLLPLTQLMIFATLQDRLKLLLMNSYFASVTDPLTGIFNKKHYHKQLQSQLNMQTNTIYAIFCDIDNFKNLNDSEGHNKGDEILIKVSSIVQEEVSHYGLAARYGGEEIVAYVNLESSYIDIKSLTERIRERVHSETIVTLSIGYAKSEPKVTYDHLVHMADIAMYYSKQNGKNRVTDYDDMKVSGKATSMVK